jgi:hypothetical protein
MTAETTTINYSDIEFGVEYEYDKGERQEINDFDGGSPGCPASCAIDRIWVVGDPKQTCLRNVIAVTDIEAIECELLGGVTA